jgi:hypothetical protein
MPDAMRYPPQIFLAESLKQAAREADTEAAAEARRVEANAAQQAQADAERERRHIEREERLQAVWLPASEQDVPDAVTLGVDVSGLAPARAMLVRFAAWQNRMQAEITDLQKQRQQFLAAQGVPMQTAEAIETLETEDRSAVACWLRRGSPAKDRPVLHGSEREALQARLANDKWLAEVAVGELDHVDDEIEIRRRTLAALAQRYTRCVNDALIAEAEPIGAEVEVLVRQLEAKMTSLVGLAHVVGHRFYPDHRSDLFVPLPQFNRDTSIHQHPNARPGIRVNARDGERAAAPWRRLAVALAADPRADLTLVAIEPKAEDE